MRFKAQTDIHVDKKKPFSLEIVNCEAIKIQEFKRLSFAFMQYCELYTLYIIVPLILLQKLYSICMHIRIILLYSYYSSKPMPFFLTYKEKCKYYNNKYLFYEN